MKKTITTLAIGFALMGIHVNAQSWQWAKGAGGTANDYANGIAVDASGNTYVTGGFSSSSITFGSTTLTNHGGIDFYLVKYDPSGNVLWAKGATGTSNEGGNNITLDASGNVYVVGTFNSSSLTFGTTAIALHGYDDIFIVKFDASGNALWAKDAGGAGNDIGENIAVDNSGNTYITGYFASSSIAFGSTTLTNTSGGSGSGGTNDFFVAKYDASGNPLWAKSAGGSSNEIGLGIAADGSGNVYVTGNYTSSSITFGSTTFTNGGGLDYFTVKYNSSGTVVWAKTASGASNEGGNGLKVDANSNPIIVGTFNSATLTFSTTALSVHGYDDIFIIKYDSSGNVLWAKNAGGSGNDIGNAICVDASGNSHITGYFSSPTIAFGSTTLTNAGGAAGSSGTNDIFIAQYDASGNALGAESASGSGNEQGNAIAVDVDGSSYIAGYYTSTTLAFGTYTLTNGGANDMYVAKYGTPFSAGINEIKSNSIDANIYPNPNNGSFVVETTNTMLNVHCTIYDVNGKLVLNQAINGKTIVDASNLNEGVYNLNIISNEGAVNKKLVIVK